MLRTVEFPRPRRRRVSKHPVKLTALLYLKEALLRENYEICPEVIATAKEFGAADFEIRDQIGRAHV